MIEREKTMKKYVWTSCCFRLDKRCVQFSVQTMIGMIILTYCGYQLSTEDNCEKQSPYWSLIGSIVGFFFGKSSIGGGNAEPAQRESLTPLRRKSPTPQNSPMPIIIRVPEQRELNLPSLSLESNEYPIDDRPTLERSPNQERVSLKPSITQQQVELLV